MSAAKNQAHNLIKQWTPQYTFIYKFASKTEMEISAAETPAAGAIAAEAISKAITVAVTQ